MQLLVKRCPPLTTAVTSFTDPLRQPILESLWCSINEACRKVKVGAVKCLLLSLFCTEVDRDGGTIYLCPTQLSRDMQLGLLLTSWRPHNYAHNYCKYALRCWSIEATPQLLTVDDPICLKPKLHFYQSNSTTVCA